MLFLIDFIGFIGYKEKKLIQLLFQMLYFSFPKVVLPCQTKS